jgi:hypothetical protein
MMPVIMGHLPIADHDFWICACSVCAAERRILFTVREDDCDYP